jgi:hypothetical protein
MLMATVAAGAAAEERPPAVPSRDVDVLYAMLKPDGPRGWQVVQERMRWAAGAGMLRIDPPTPGMWVVVDTRARRLAAVREADHSVLEIDSADAMPGPPSDAAFLRRGADVVADVPCTEWQTKDLTGEPTLACITADGVLLRAVGAGRVLVEALRLNYRPQDQSVFRIPQDYRRIEPPPKRPAP